MQPIIQSIMYSSKFCNNGALSGGSTLTGKAQSFTGSAYGGGSPYGGTSMDGLSPTFSSSAYGATGYPESPFILNITIIYQVLNRSEVV